MKSCPDTDILTEPSCFTHFIHDVSDDTLPEKFTFPFCYEPHPIAVKATTELQLRLEEMNITNHDFGLEDGQSGVGKMFGVLVVKTHDEVLGYLSAFSGKLGQSNHYPGFVPPVFDTHDLTGFYKKGEEEINLINRRIEKLESAEEYLQNKTLLENKKNEAASSVKSLKNEIKLAKISRDARRKEVAAETYDAVNEILNQESITYHYRLKELNKYWKQRLEDIQQQLNIFQAQIQAHKDDRRQRSALLQKKLFEQYAFLNQQNQKKNLIDIFEITDELTPPSGAGECAAPKLLQYAFRHHLIPVAMAEFWWGKSPASEIRKHGHFYPACNGKCKPILSHMLEGIPMDENPMLTNPAIGKKLPVIMEDDFILIVNKPAEFLSVPGKKIVDSVFSRVRMMYPKATGPLIVHRLDMSTSGIMLIAKTKEIHQHLQSQFIKRKIKKKYVAILDGCITGTEGEIDLPIRVDLDDRPRQLVCYQYGKPALTLWQVAEQTENGTRVYFYPHTGRTHQLRVHAAHPSGLGTPIKGDDLYGTRADRLYLHAETLDFIHPITKEWVHVECKPDF
ncbi:MAG: RNA pseudouridine synthase [Saprospiraceae bacterium]|nr:RNA pseudouridine synthase [Saprospiraceae bacterium]